MARPENQYDIRDFVPGTTPMTQQNITRLSQYRGLVSRWAHNEEHGEIARMAFEEGVDATLELLRPLLNPSPGEGDCWAVERYVGKWRKCTGCDNDKGDWHSPDCPWPKIDELMATSKGVSDA